MNRPQKLGRFFQELKSALGSEIPTTELLEAASAMVSIHDRVMDPTPKASIAENDRSFESIETGIAMSDGGWRVMDKERELMRNFICKTTASTQSFKTLLSCWRELRHE